MRRILSRAAVSELTQRGLLFMIGAALVGGVGVASAQDTNANANQQPAAKQGTHHTGTAGASGQSDLKSQASYSFGLLMGERLHEFGLGPTDLNSVKFQEGIRAALSGKGTAGPEDEQRAQQFIQQTRASMSQKNEEIAKRFLARNAKAPGVQSLPSGLEYKVINPGSGNSPAPTDEVTVNYRGTLLDGKEFDSSYKRGQPATFTLNRIIKGWQEALVLMKPGAKWDLFIPPDLAYGANSPPPIPPGSLLKFEVELLSAKPAPPAPVRPALPVAPPHHP